MKNNLEKNLKNKKFNFLNFNIVAILLLISFISVIIIKFINFKFLEEDTIYYISDKLRTSVESSIYNKYDNYYFNNKYDNYYFSKPVNEDLVQSNIRSYKIINYGFTDEFRTKFPNKVVVQEQDENYIIYDKDEYESIKDGFEKTKTTLNTVENPEYKVINLSNGAITYENINPQDINYEGVKKYDKENYVIIKGLYDTKTKKVNITENKLVGKTNNSNEKYLQNRLKRIIINRLNEIRDEFGIQKLNFCYIIDFNSKSYLNELALAELKSNEIPKIIIVCILSFVLVGFICIITNYKKSKEKDFFKAIEKFPVDVVCICILIWFIVLGASFKLLLMDLVNYSNLQSITILIMISEFIFLFFGYIAIFYIIHGMKSLYYEGGSSFVVKNSIIYKILNSVKMKLFKRTRINILSNKTILFIIILLILLGFIASFNVVRADYSIIVFLLWLIFIAIGIHFLKKYYFEIIEITEISNEIAKGNYKININEENKTFKDLAYNLNNIRENLNNSIEKAIKSERLKTELITNVSHDLKTPLTSIINYSQLIIDEKTSDEEIKEYTKIINEKSNKLKVLIEDLFEVSKANSKNIKLNLENLDLREILNQVMGEWEEKIEKKGIQIVTNTQKSILELDGRKTSRVLDNLFSNIYKYTLENTRVYVDLNEKGDLTIKNISKYPLNMEVEDLIERFTRGDSARTTEGTGLGLSIATSFIEAQGGTFEIDIDGDLFKTIIKFKK